MKAYHDIPLRSARNRLLNVLFDPKKYSVDLLTDTEDVSLRVTFVGGAATPSVEIKLGVPENNAEVGFSISDNSRLTIILLTAPMLSTKIITAWDARSNVAKGGFILSLPASNPGGAAKISTTTSKIALVESQTDSAEVAPADPVLANPLRDLPVIYSKIVTLDDPGIIYVIGAEKEVEYFIHDISSADHTGDIAGTIIDLEAEKEYPPDGSAPISTDINKVFTDLLVDDMQAQIPAAPSLKMDTNEERNHFIKTWKRALRFDVSSIGQNTTYAVLAKKQIGGTGLIFETQLATPVNYFTKIKTDLTLEFVEKDKQNATETPIALADPISINHSAKTYFVRIQDSQLKVDYQVVRIVNIEAQEGDLTPIDASLKKFQLATDVQGEVLSISYDGKITNPQVTIKQDSVNGEDVVDFLLEETPSSAKLTITLENLKTPVKAALDKWVKLSVEERGDFSLNGLKWKERSDKEEGNDGVLELSVKLSANPEENKQWAVNASRSGSADIPFEEEILDTTFDDVTVLFRRDILFDFASLSDSSGIPYNETPQLKIPEFQNGVAYELHAFRLPASFTFEFENDRSNQIYEPDGALIIADHSTLMDDRRDTLIYTFAGGGLSPDAGNLPREDSLLKIRAKRKDTGEEQWLDHHLTALIKPDLEPALSQELLLVQADGKKYARLLLNNVQSRTGYLLQKERKDGSVVEVGPLLPAAKNIGWSAHGRVFGMQVRHERSNPHPGDFSLPRQDQDLNNLINKFDEGIAPPIQIEFIIPLEADDLTCRVLAIKEYTNLQGILSDSEEIPPV